MQEVEGGSVLEKLEKFNRRFSSWFEWVGLAAMLLMIVITCIDVVGGKVFHWRLLGAIDAVMLSQIVAIAFPGSMVLILGRHIQVEFFVAQLPGRVQAVIDSIVSLLGLGLFSVIVWQLSVLGYTFQTSGEHSSSAYIPYFPFAYCIALASIPVFLVFLLEFLKSMKRLVQK
jgi:TRAP-type C4-dicarboxylate transport system permease small subunit